MAPPALIIGCGYLGSRIANAWLASGRRVVALTRNRVDELTKLGIKPIVGDVLDPASLAGSLSRSREPSGTTLQDSESRSARGTYPELPAFSTVLYAVGLDRAAGRSMHDVYVGGLANVLAALPQVDRIIYISSTSVYGQTDGSLVDELAETVPLEDSGRTVLEAERTLRASRPDAIILRFAGIYGPDRLLRKAAILAGKPFVGDAEKWLNLIHVDDGCRAVQLAETSATPGSTYNIADDTPVTRRQFYTRLVEALSSGPARFEPHPPGQVPTREANRRISNAKAKRELGFVPMFPSYIEGLANAVRWSTIKLS